jgi:hypothetical protein
MQPLHFQLSPYMTRGLGVGRTYLSLHRELLILYSNFLFFL